MTFSHKFIFILLVIQPLIDLITSLSTHYSQLPVSIGALLKTALMGVLVVYLIYYFYPRNKWLFIIFIGSYLSIIITLIINFVLKRHFVLFAELNFALKTSYYITMIYSAIMLFNHRSLTKQMIDQATKTIALIIGLSYWFAIITQTAFASYQHGGPGFSGWFYAANELSVIVIVLLGLAIVNLKNDHSVTAWGAMIFMLSMVPMIGTKTAFLGGGIIILFSCLYALLDIFSGHQRGKNALYLSLIILFICFIPLTPIAAKSAHTDNGSQLHPKQESGAEKGSSDVFKKVLSSRDLYFDSIKADYQAAQGIRKLFGLGYSGDYKTKPELIEMDFFDLFFSYGVIGSIFLLSPLLYAIYNVLVLNGSEQYVILLISLGLSFGIAFFAGHVLFAPAVMTYVALTLIAIEKVARQTGEAYE